MCACGRKRADAVTSVQAAQEVQARDAAQAALEMLSAETVSAAEQMIQSASRAIGNAHSHR
jgi:cellobiose-specific phosphotransferase system component IIA